MGTLDNMIQGVFDSIRLRSTFFQSISDRNQLSIQAMKIQSKADQIEVPESHDSVEDEYIPSPEEETEADENGGLKMYLRVDADGMDSESLVAADSKKGALPGANLDFEV